MRAAVTYQHLAPHLRDLRSILIWGTEYHSTYPLLNPDRSGDTVRVRRRDVYWHTTLSKKDTGLPRGQKGKGSGPYDW